MNNMLHLGVEAIVVGLIITFIGLCIYNMCQNIDIFKSYNKYYIQSLYFFSCGVITHLLFEFTGANNWYCKNGVACR